jgi:hypothetical protein
MLKMMRRRRAKERRRIWRGRGRRLLLRQGESGAAVLDSIRRIGCLVWLWQFNI